MDMFVLITEEIDWLCSRNIDLFIDKVNRNYYLRFYVSFCTVIILHVKVAHSFAAIQFSKMFSW